MPDPSNLKVGPLNDTGDEILVYIRSLAQGSPGPENRPSYDHYVMTSLPTNDNPRYAFYADAMSAAPVSQTDVSLPEWEITVHLENWDSGTVTIDIITDGNRKKYGLNNKKVNTFIVNSRGYPTYVLNGFGAFGNGIKVEVKQNGKTSGVARDVYQDIMSTRYYEFKTGPCDIKIQYGPYPARTGVNDILYPATGVAQVKVFHDNTYNTFYYKFITDTGRLKYDYIPYREYQLGILDREQNPSTGYIDSTGVPEIKFAELKDDLTAPITEIEFDLLPVLSVIATEGSGATPRVVPQTGLILLSDTKGKTTRNAYEMVYPFTYKTIDFDSLEPETFESRTFTKGDEKDSIPMLVSSGYVQSMNGAFSPAQTYEKRRMIGPESFTMPLHELNFYPRGIGCKATHLAYKIGQFGKYAATIGYLNSPPAIVYSENPAVFLFNSSANFYKRLPECWPWSCRRWTVENTTSGIKGSDGKTTYKNIIKYYTQDASGEKKETSIEKIPKFSGNFSTFLGTSHATGVYILNGDPFPKVEAGNTLTGPGKGTVMVPMQDPNTYINGYFLEQAPITMGDMDDKKMTECGCDPDDAKVTFAGEVFPILHQSQCKLIMKAGFLCYPTSGCQVPNPGTITKKIITPFNSCRFNESLQIDLLKLKFPDIQIDNTSITFDPAEGVMISYYFATEIGPYDPLYKVTETPTSTIQTSVDISDGYTISTADKFPNISEYYIFVIARYPCKYTTDVMVYKKTDVIEQYSMIPMNEVYDCPTNYLGRFQISGNGTDEKEDSSQVTTGGDYYLTGATGANGATGATGATIHTAWNDCDPPYQGEIYKSQSLGNIKGFITIQDQCCEFCTGKEPGFKTNDNCFQLPIEGTSSWINHYVEGGSCDLGERKRCDRDRLQGRANLRVKVVLEALTSPSVIMNVYSTVQADGFIRPKTP